MAIDDNTSYELTGAQVKDLASKINAKEDSADLAAVAESGSYNDLLNKPTIPAAQVNSDWDAASGVAQILNKPSLATVATSGSYNDLSNKPTIGNATITIQKNGTSAGTFTTNATSNKSINITVPTATSDLTNDSGFITGIPTASTTTLGGIKVGDNLSIDANGVLSADDCPVYTATNVAPTADTVDAWVTALGGNGVYFTWYTQSNKFTKQPAQYGFLRTIIGGSDIRQEWWTQTNGWHGMRTGNYAGWSSTSGTDGTFINMGTKVDSSLSTSSTNPVQNKVVTTKINEIDRFYRGLVPLGTEIIADKDLNTVEFLSVGKYYCSRNVTVATLTNCPTSTAFMMEVFSPLSTTIDNETTGTWVYRMRLITELDGDMWYQSCNSNGTANNWTYNAWHKIARIDDIDAKPNSYWGTCTTAADVAAKVVTVSSSQNFKLVPGAMITFALSASNTAENPTINVNNTGAKQVKYNSAVITTGNLNRVGYNTRPTTFVYDGTYWVWVSWSVDDNTTYSAMSVAEGEAGTATTARTMRADRLKQIIEYYNPTVNNATLTVTQNGTSVGTFTANSSTDTTLALTDTTYSDMTGATSSTAGAHGLVPAPSAGDEGKYLKGDGTWGGEVTIRLLPDPMISDTVYITGDMTSELPTTQLYFSTLFSDDVKRVVYKHYDMEESDFTWYEYYTIVNKYTDITSNSGTCTLVNDSGTTIVLSASLESTLAGKTIAVTRPINSEEVIYNYTQASNSSANVDVDAPIDLTTYKEIRIVAFDISTNNGTWMTFTPLDSSKSPRTTYLHGYEVIGSAISAVNRADTQCGAVSIGANGVGGVETIIERGGANDWTAFQTHGFGEGSVQSVGGLIKASASTTAYVRVRLVSPKAGSRVTVYGKR